MYEVIYRAEFGNPMEMENWLNSYLADGKELVGMQGNYYVFKSVSSAKTGIVARAVQYVQGVLDGELYMRVVVQTNLDIIKNLIGRDVIITRKE